MVSFRFWWPFTALGDATRSSFEAENDHGEDAGRRDGDHDLDEDDVSRQAAEDLGFTKSGKAKVKLEVEK